MYAAGGSPAVGALHVSVTELPDDDARRFSGALGAIAAATPIALACTRSALKHEDVADPDKQDAKDGTDDPMGATIAPKPIAVAEVGVAAGAVGESTPHARVDAVTIALTNPTSSRRITSL
jgi:hypothetical protein